MAQRATARPQRIRQKSPELRCEVLTVYGYRAEHPDGWRGPFRRKYRDAENDARDQNRAEGK